MAPALTSQQVLAGLERIRAFQLDTRLDLARTLAASTAALEARWATEPARLFVHISDESQRGTAQALRQRLGGSDDAPASFNVAGIELVPGYQGPAELRCFRAFECEREGPRLVAMVNAALGSDIVRLINLSKRYGASTDIRPRTYELWLGPKVALKGP